MPPIFRPALPLLCLLLTLPGCANNKAREEASRATVTISSDGKRLVYNGKIKASTVDEALALYQAAQHKPDTLDISSQGGSLYDGIRLGMLVHRQQLDVRIFGECASSCANYIFPAGKTSICCPTAGCYGTAACYSPTGAHAYSSATPTTHMRGYVPSKKTTGCNSTKRRSSAGSA